MGMDEKARLDAFEKMLHAIRENYQNTDQKMKRLKEEGKEKLRLTASLWEIKCNIRICSLCIRYTD